MNEINVNEIELNGIKYIPKDSVKNTELQSLNGLKYVIVRTYSAGVFAGYLKSQSGKEVELLNARRLWYWKGAASLSQLSIDGVKYPDECKFPDEVSEIKLMECIEIIPCSQKSYESIKSVKIWKV